MMRSTAINTVNDFLLAVDVRQDYKVAANWLADDFTMVSPMESFRDKDDWLRRFPDMQKRKKPSFDEPIEDSKNQSQIFRYGKVKIGMLTLTIRETYKIDDAGRITKISVSKA